MKPKDFDDYLDRIDEPARSTLEKVRKMIHAAAPGAEEVISYQLPTFRYQNRMLVSIGYAKTHCALYGLSGTLHRKFEKELAKYDTSKGTIRFPHDKPPPATFVKKLVKARILENAEASARKRTPKS